MRKGKSQIASVDELERCVCTYEHQFLECWGENLTNELANTLV